MKKNLYNEYGGYVMKKESVYYEKLGTILRNARLDKRMTMKDLCEQIGLKEVAIHQYETGKRKISLEIFFKVCKILDLDVDEVQKELNKYL